MKKISLFALAFLTLGMLSMTGPQQEPGDGVTIPDDVKAVLEKSCWGCHSSESSNPKGKLKIKFDELSDLKKSKLIAKMDEIVEVCKEGEMPPSKFIEKNPDKAPTEDEVKLIIDWASSYLAE